MHWNLSHDNSNFNLNKNRPKLMNELCIPFQLFGLTPLSCGFNVRTCKSDNRYEVMGDSLTNIDQIKATALLLGAYSAATETTNFKKNIFPIKTSIYTPYNYKKNMLKNGRYSEVNVYSGSKSNRKIQSTQAQNVLEVFYEWINPFVYKLGERDEINNLEAFIKGDKKLEMDDLKYFNELKKRGKIGKYGVYIPEDIATQNDVRSQVLKIINNANLEAPIEGKLLGIYAKNNHYDSKNPDKFVTTSMEWNEIIVDTKFFLDGSPKEHLILKNLKDMFNFVETEQDKRYLTTSDTNDTNLQNFINTKISSKLKKRIRYNANKDLSALIK